MSVELYGVGRIWFGRWPNTEKKLAPAVGAHNGRKDGSQHFGQTAFHRHKDKDKDNSCIDKDNSCKDELIHNFPGFFVQK